MKTRQRRSPHGFTLLEIMVAMVIFAIGFLGITQLQVVAARSGQAARRTTEATALAEHLASRLAVLNWNDPALVDSDTSNDTGFITSANITSNRATSVNLESSTATADHCFAYGTTAAPPASWVTCHDTLDSSVLTGLPGLVPASAVIDQPGESQRYYLAWDVENVNLKGDLTAGNYDSKIVVARVFWKDPALGSMRSESVAVIIANPSINRN